MFHPLMSAIKIPLKQADTEKIIYPNFSPIAF